MHASAAPSLQPSATSAQALTSRHACAGGYLVALCAGISLALGLTRASVNVMYGDGGKQVPACQSGRLLMRQIERKPDAARLPAGHGAQGTLSGCAHSVWLQLLAVHVC